MPETAKRTARVPILGEDGRISDDYVPAAIGEGVESAEAAATRAETAATNAEGSATAASQSAKGAQGSASAASTSATQAQESATAASGAVTQAQSAQQAAEAAKTGAESARGSAQTAASQAKQSATAAASSAASVADKFIASAQATTLEPGSEATASVADQVLTLGIPQGDKGEKGDKGDKGDPGDVSAVQVTEGSDLSVSMAEGTVTIDDSALRERIAELENQAANVVTGISTGLVSHGEDAYAQKPREVHINGKTWVNRWPVINSKSNDIAVSTDETGLVTVSGELGLSSKGAYNFKEIRSIAPNKSITVLCSRGLPDGVYLYVSFHGAEGGIVGRELQVGFDSTSETSKTVTVPSGTVSAWTGVAVKSNTVLSGALSFRVMLVDGTEAPDCFTPCASITSVETGNLVTSGKNLFGISQEFSDLTGFGDTQLYDEGDGWVRAEFASSALGIEYKKSKIRFMPTTYTVSFEAYANKPVLVGYLYITNTVDGNIQLSRYGATAPSVTTEKQRVSFKFTLNREVNGSLLIGIGADQAVGVELHIRNLQLELGSTATAYEPPTATQTPLPEVELRSLPNGTCDELVIKADGTCEVERNTVQVTFDGSEDEAFTADGQTIGEAYRYRINAQNSASTSQNDAICDRFSMSYSYNSSVAGSFYVSENSILFFSDISTLSEFETWLQSNPTTVIYKRVDATEPQSPVALPTLPAPTFNQYHDSPVPSDTSTEYARDINIVIDNLAKQIAGTAATVAINEATR